MDDSALGSHTGEGADETRARQVVKAPDDRVQNVPEQANDGGGDASSRAIAALARIPRRRGEIPGPEERRREARFVLDYWAAELCPELDGPLHTPKRLNLVTARLAEFSPATLMSAIDGARTSPHNAPAERRTVRALFRTPEGIQVLAALGRNARLGARSVPRPRAAVPPRTKTPPGADSGPGIDCELSITEVREMIADAFKTPTERNKRP